MTYEELTAAAQEYGVSITPELQTKLATYAKLLKEWNEKMNLTAIVEEPDVIEKHFLDSLTCAAVFDFSGKSVADIGSGAGFPGIIIALAFPSANLDRRHKEEVPFSGRSEENPANREPKLPYRARRRHEKRTRIL